jgi:hypothetical protein
MMPLPVRTSFSIRTVLALLAVLASACSPSQTPPPPNRTDTALLGEFKPIVSVKELMQFMIDPVADNIFDAVGTVITAKGVVETAPMSDEEWDKVRVGAVSLVEGVYLLKVPRPFAPAGDENNSIGEGASELPPAQITAKVKADPVLWNAKIEALRNVGLEVLEIVKKKDAQALFSAAGDLDEACEGCHLEYWYPGEKDLGPRLDRRLRELKEQHRP